jgi:hypothetical protein
MTMNRKSHGFRGHNLLTYSGCTLVSLGCFAGLGGYIVAHPTIHFPWWGYPIFIIGNYPLTTRRSVE